MQVISESCTLHWIIKKIKIRKVTQGKMTLQALGKKLRSTGQNSLPFFGVLNPCTTFDPPSVTNIQYFSVTTVTSPITPKFDPDKLKLYSRHQEVF